MNKICRSYLTPVLDFSLRDVFYGHSEAVADSKARVDDSESPFAQDRAHLVGLFEGLLIAAEDGLQEGRRRCCKEQKFGQTI